jgi:hypothetical protein
MSVYNKKWWGGGGDIPMMPLLVFIRRVALAGNRLMSNLRSQMAGTMMQKVWLVAGIVDLSRQDRMSMHII